MAQTGHHTHVRKYKLENLSLKALLINPFIRCFCRLLQTFQCRFKKR